MPYTPPAWNAADIAFDVPYTVPAWDAADIEFVDGSYQTLLPSSFTSDAFGSATISNASDIVTTGINDGAFGSATVYIQLVLQPSGIYDGALGTHRVENYYRYLYPYGLASTTGIGIATLANLNREITLTGFETAAYGTALVFDPSQPIYTVGFDWLTWGTAEVILKNSYISVTGTKFDEFGVASIENYNRDVYPQRIDPVGFGDTTIYNLTQYRDMTGFMDDVFGLPYIIGPRYLRPTGWQDDRFLPTNEVSNFYRTMFPTGIPATFPATGDATIYNEDLFVFPDPIGPEEMYGAIVAIPPFDIIDVTGYSISESEITSEADIYYGSMNHLYVRAGINSSGIGSPTITPAILSPTAISSGTYGRPTVSNYIRYLFTNATNSLFTRYGTPWVSHYIRYLEPTGFDSSVVWYAFGPINLDGTVPGVKGSAVYIYPDGFDASGTTYDPCGFPRTPPIPRPSVHP